MLGLLAIDSGGQPLAPALIHSDARAGEQAVFIAQEVGADRIYRITGNVLDARSPLAKLLWFKQHQSAAYAKAHRFLQSKDFVAGRLVGAFDSTDYSDACHAQWLDINSSIYATDVLAQLGLDVAKLPQPHAATEIIGKLTRAAAIALDLPSGIPVVAGGGDGACATAGSGAIADGDTYCCIGTSAWIASVAPRPFIDPQRRLFNLTALDGKTFGTYGTVQAAGRAIQWTMDLIGQKGYGDFDSMLAGIDPGSAGLTFLPYLEGERSPIWDADARGVLFGISSAHTPAHVLRATVEGVCFALSSVLQAIRESRPIPAMRLIGGGGQSPAWQQMLADICRVEIQIPSVQASDATSLGAAIAAGVGAGIYPSFADAVRSIRIRDQISPNAARSAYYVKHQKFYTELYARLKQAFKVKFGFS